MGDKLFLLDAGGAFLIVIPLLFIVHFLFTLFVEAGTLYYFKYKNFRGCLIDALIVNICSLFLGIFCLIILNNIKIGDGNGIGLWFQILLFFILTLAVEGLILRKINRSFPAKKLWVANGIMNTITYSVIFILLLFIG